MRPSQHPLGISSFFSSVVPSLALGFALSLAFAAAGLSSAARAATVTWIGNTDANLATAANWDVAPVSNDTLAFGAAGTSGTTLNYDFASGAFNMTFNSGASAYTFTGSTMGWTGTSSLILNNSASLQTFDIGISRNGNGTIDAASGAFLLNGGLMGTASGDLTVRGTGGVTFAGTTAFGDMVVHSNNNSSSAAVGILNITGSTTLDGGSTANQGNVTVGSGGGNGRVNIGPGGSLLISGTTNATKQNSLIGQQSAGEINVNGGSLTFGSNASLIIGNSSRSAGLGGGGGVGTLNVNSGTVTIHKGDTTTTTNGPDTTVVMMGRDNNAATGTINLNGGTLATDRQFVRDGSTTGGDGIANFNFNGGTLQALGDQTDWLRSTTTGAFRDLTAVTVQAGGAVIDSNGFDVAINNVLAHDTGVTTDGGLTKQGAGTLTLGGNSTYNGTTTVSGGTLLINGDFSAATGDVIVAAGAALGGSGIVGGNTTVSGTLSAGNSPGLMTFNADLTLESTATSFFEIDGTTRGGTYDAVDVLGNLVYGGELSLLFGYMPLLSDTFNLFDFAGAQSGSFTSINFLNAGFAGTFDGATGVLTMTAVPEPSSWGMLAGGLGSLVWMLRRRKAGAARA